MLKQLFGSNLRAKLLGWLMTHAERRYFVRELTGLLEEDSTNVSRELARLERMGILTSRQEGRQKYYQANPRCPVFGELRGLAIKTAGLGDVLRAALRSMADRIVAAFVFGSFAQGQGTALSDVDLMVVGNVRPKDLANALRPSSRQLGREINAVVYPPNEFRRKAKARHHFITTVLKDEKLYLIGDADDLKAVTG